MWVSERTSNVLEVEDLMHVYIVHDWHDFQLLGRKKGINPYCKVSSIIIHDFTVGRHAKFDELFPGCQYVLDTVANVVLDWCNNPEVASCFVIIIGLKRKNIFDQFMVMELLPFSF